MRRVRRIVSGSGPWQTCPMDWECPPCWAPRSPRVARGGPWPVQVGNRHNGPTLRRCGHSLVPDDDRRGGFWGRPVATPRAGLGPLKHAQPDPGADRPRRAANARSERGVSRASVWPHGQRFAFVPARATFEGEPPRGPGRRRKVCCDGLRVDANNSGWVGGGGGGGARPGAWRKQLQAARFCGDAAYCSAQSL